MYWYLDVSELLTHLTEQEKEIACLKKEKPDVRKKEEQVRQKKVQTQKQGIEIKRKDSELKLNDEDIRKSTLSLRRTTTLHHQPLQRSFSFKAIGEISRVRGFFLCFVFLINVY